MTRRMGLRLAVLLGLAAVVVAALGATTGSSRPLAAKSAAASNVIIDGTTGTVVNIDPANQYDYDSFTLDLPLFQGLYGFPHGAKLAPVLATGCKASEDLKTWTCGALND